MYDAIVVGARCAGAPTAMLLARQGHRVLLVDKASRGSDTISSHMFHQVGILYLKRWGLLGRLQDAGTPPCGAFTFFVDGTPLPTPTETTWDVEGTYAPRRTVLDAILLDAAIDAGVEFREHFTVTDLIATDGTVRGIRGHGAGGREHGEWAAIVIGADGKSSTVARLVDAPWYRTEPPADCGLYGYWSGVDMRGYEWHSQTGLGGVLAAPTNDGLVCVVTGGFEPDRFVDIRSDAQAVIGGLIDQLPALAPRVREGRLETRVFAWKDGVNGFRTPFGRGWALVGDAGYYKHPVTGLGMSDAFRDAESLARSVHDALTGQLPMPVALAGYARERDEAASELYDVTRRVLDTYRGPDRGGAAFGRLTELSRTWAHRVAAQGYLDEPAAIAV